MKKTIRLLSMILSVILLVSCLGIQTFAESPQYNKTGFTYVCFGDSYSRGMGCSDTWKEDTELDFAWYDNQSRNVRGCYPYLVATELRCDTTTDNNYLNESDATFWPLIQNGQRIAGVLDGLGIDDGYYDSEFYHQEGRGHAIRYMKFLKYFGNPDSSTGPNGEKYGKFGTVYDARELIQKADLITLQLGMADVFNRPVYAAAQKCLPAGTLDFTGASARDIAKFTKQLIKNMNEGYEYFLRAYPILLDYLTKQNDGGEIAILTLANPAFGVEISDDIAIPIGTAFSTITALCNKKIKEWAEEYDLIYVDISNVDTGCTTFGWTLIEDVINAQKEEVGTHPSAEGHKQIARMIMSAYKNRDQASTTDIVVDLGRFSSVDYVLLNGILLDKSKYSVENNVLTIKNKSKLKLMLTVAVKKSSKDYAFTFYQLSYNKKSGYSAYRMYTTNSLLSLVS